MTTYLLHSLAWSAAGFVLGWFLGRLGREVATIGETVMPAHARRSPRRIRLHTEHLIGLVVVLLAACTIAASVVVNARLEKATDCQAAFNAAYSDALAERTEAANNERAAQRELLQAIVHGQASDAEQRRAVARDAMTRYLERLRQVDQQRASNPLPETNCAR